MVKIKKCIPFVLPGTLLLIGFLTFACSGRDICVYDTDCPSDHVCHNGYCRDLCYGITCPEGEYCLGGLCIPSPCTDTSCTNPPGDPACYNLPALCEEGTCEYMPNTGHTCDDGNPCTTDNVCLEDGRCSGLPVACNDPPEPSCQDEQSLISYISPGTCLEGICEYSSFEVICPDGCVQGACSGDPCADISCNHPPDNFCVNDSTLRSYRSEGNCENGICNYPFDDYVCPSGCSNGTCEGCTPEWTDIGSCSCNPTACSSCNGTRQQTDGCGQTRKVECTLPAIGCSGPCCQGICCESSQVCNNGLCCTPQSCEQSGILCGPSEDGCGEIIDCGDCGANQNCINGACICLHLDCNGICCAQGEQCISGFCQLAFGWDPGLKRRCASTTGNPGDENYFAVTDDCTPHNPGNSRWLLVVQSENAPTASCPGPVNRSFLINGANSPVNVNYHARTHGTYSVNMKVDHHIHPHPCGNGYFTFLAFMDHEDFSEGPYPLPRNLITSHIINYNHWAPTHSDAVRGIVAAQFWWDGKARLIEVFISSVNWGDAVPEDPCTILATEWTDELTFVSLEGSCFGLQVTPGGNDTLLEINWRDLIDYCVQHQYFPAPADWNNTAVQSVYTAIEVMNGGVAEMWHADFSISELVP